MWGFKTKGRARTKLMRARSETRDRPKKPGPKAHGSPNGAAVQRELRDQLERNHWAELIFGRLN
ncbi:hypothetical protein [Gordonia westfalica]|uniref:Uncharacterized protein n=1 Tax=Gordonia westfalica TaxID=158898 RepID=A0A1H2EH79_9ACTN|nr:hypothetical protein [Gordonia westfalica]SDT94414.1 hypothetical protein SAMN04488548_13130 [Gordonia westfalica]